MQKDHPEGANLTDDGQEISIETVVVDTAVVETVDVKSEQKSTNGWESVDTKVESDNAKSNIVDVENIGSTEEGSSQGSNLSMLYRHPTHKVVGGVCGGVADFLGWDPALVRILWVVATFATGGGGFLAYLALWLLLPVGTSTKGQQRPAAIELNERSLSMAASVLIGIGILWLTANLPVLGWLWDLFWSTVGAVFWPAILIGAGLLLLNRNGSRDWRGTMRNTTSRFRTSVGSNMPSGSNVRDGMNKARSYVPLRRSNSDRVVFGVCGGIGKKIGIDANLVRLIWGAFTFASLGIGGVAIYAVATLIMPEESLADVATSQSVSQDIDGTVQV